MYLHLLKDKEKENFLELANYLANCDNDYSEEERRLIEKYRHEMKLYESKYSIRPMILEDILNNLSHSDFKSKTAMFVELIGLAMADLKYDGREKELIEKLKRIWDIDDVRYSAFLQWFEEMDGYINFKS